MNGWKEGITEMENQKVTCQDILPLREYISNTIDTNIKSSGLTYKDVANRIENFSYMNLFSIIGRENVDINHLLKVLEALDLTIVIKSKRG